MVFIHGGYFVFGAGSLPRYDAASGDIIVLTLNYRLGSLGLILVPVDPIAASSCAALWATQPPFTGSFPTP